MSPKSLLLTVAVLLGSLGIATPAAYVLRALLLDNSPPIANGDNYTLHGNGYIGSILANDFDPDPGNTISAVQVTSPTNGMLSYAGNGIFYYARYSSSWTGTDSFTYRACENQSPSLCSSVVTVTITVVNQSPVAVNDVYNVHGSTIIGPYKVNDSDPDGDPITNYQLTSTSHGILQYGGQVDKNLYRPNQGFVGTDSFTYKVCDQFNSCSSPATVFINVSNTSPGVIFESWG